MKLAIAEGRTPEDAAANLGMPINTLIAWVSKARRNLSGGSDAFTPPTQQQMVARLHELEAENRRLKLERDILKEATAFFAREGDRP